MRTRMIFITFTVMCYWTPTAFSGDTPQTYCGPYLGPDRPHQCHINAVIDEPGISTKKIPIRIDYTFFRHEIVDSSVCGNGKKGSLLYRACRNEARKIFKKICNEDQMGNHIYCYRAENLSL
jgi:hypothetical protein